MGVVTLRILSLAYDFIKETEVANEASADHVSGRNRNLFRSSLYFNFLVIQLPYGTTLDRRSVNLQYLIFNLK